METQKILGDLEALFREVLNQPGLQLFEDTTANDVAGWDSLNHAILMSEVQKQFKLQFSIKEVLGLKKVGDLVTIIALRKAGKS